MRLMTNRAMMAPLLSIISLLNHARSFTVRPIPYHRKKIHSLRPLCSTTPTSNDENKKSPPQSSSIYDLLILGGGPVGVQASILAASYSKKVAIIDAPLYSGALYDESSTPSDLSLGGPTGLFSKALRDTSKRISVATLRGMGLREESVWGEIVSNCVDLAGANAGDVERQLRFAGVDLVRGFGSFCDGGKEMTMMAEEDVQRLVRVVVKNGEDSRVMEARNVLIATGSRANRPEDIPFDGRRVFDSDSINGLSYLPKSIAITGSGIIAIEFAKIFRNLGTDVTLVIRDNNARKALMKIGLDKDVAACLVADLIRSGIKFERGAQVKRFDVPPAEKGRRVPLRLTLEGRNGGTLPSGLEEKEIKCDAYLAAVGRVSNADKLGLDAVGIEVDEYGGVVVGRGLMTRYRNVYAAGDVLGRPFLASTGVAQAFAAVKEMFEMTVKVDLAAACGQEGHKPSLYDSPEICIDWDLSSVGSSFDPASLACNPFSFPVGIWSSPESAWFGLTTEQAKDMGIQAEEGIAIYAECTRGQVFSPNGILKLVFEKESGRIVGVHICGDDACELIHYGMELIRSRRTIQDVVAIVFSAVTYHELYRIAATAGTDQAGARKRRAAVGAALASRMRSNAIGDGD